MSSIIVTIYTPQELNHSSYIQTGLFELEREGFLKTYVKISLSKRLGTIKIDNGVLIQTNEPHPKTSFYEIEDKSSGKKIKFATDLYDASFSFSAYALEHCDYVFKRNFEKKIIENLPLKYQEKIMPLGLTFKVLSSSKKQPYKFLIGLLVSNFLISIKLDSYFFKRITTDFKKQSKHWVNYKKSIFLTTYESLTTNLENYIFFQTRCFSNEDQADVLAIHKQRFRIVMLLKKRFKEKFKGGIIPSTIAKTKYKEALTNQLTDANSYLELIKKAKIVIYTRGLVNSPAWKISEYLSQGKVIIAEKLTAELPISLLNGKEVLFFENEEEIPSLIEKVMYNDELCASLAKNARHYFEQNVHPKQNVKRILNFMIQNK